MGEGGFLFLRENEKKMDKFVPLDYSKNLSKRQGGQEKRGAAREKSVGPKSKSEIDDR